MQADGLGPDVATGVAPPTSTSPCPAARLWISAGVYQNAIDARDATGPLGYGWTDNWQYSLSVASDGTVTVTMPSGQSSASSSPTAGPAAITSTSPATTASSPPEPAGRSRLQETNGQVETFNADGTLNYIQDTNGNRITAGYTGGRLTSLTDTSGASLTIAYNAAGLIASVASPDGRDGRLHLRFRRAPHRRDELRRHRDALHL